tara:strand:- start:34 stop:1128 length:1095 start_codon:yes stop_codon:yes gene_type:complete
MAKEYAYYLEGGKLAIVERDTNFDNNVDSKEFGPGVSRQQWKSPKTSVTDGLEIKYAYAPFFENSLTGGNTYHIKYFGWGRDKEGYLLLFTHTYGTNAPLDLSTRYDLNEYVEIKNSQRWNGFHKVIGKKDAPTTWENDGAYGVLKLETKCNAEDMFPSSQFYTNGWNIAVADSGNRGYIEGDTATFKAKVQMWKEQVQSSSLNPIVANRTAPFYIFLAEFGESVNSGLYEVTYPETDGKIQFEKQLRFDANGTPAWYTETVVAETDRTGGIYQVFLDEMDVFGTDDDWNEQPVQPIDEDYILDLPSYLQKALVYYVKAKVAEDAGNFEVKEYMQREFRKIVEKHESNLIKGPRMISPGRHAIR